MRTVNGEMVEQSDIGPGQSSVHVAIYPQFIDATNDFNKLEDSVASSCPEFSVMAESVSEENPDVGRQDELASLDSSYHAILGATSSQHLASQFASVATNTLIPRGHPPADVEEGRHRQFADNPVVSPLPTSFSDGDQASHDSSAPDTIPVDDGLNSSESDEMYTTPLADLASGYTWSLHHSDPDSDIDTDMSFLNALQPIVHATHDTDTDDGWHGGEMCEAPENESLIGPSSLHSFEIDKLPHDMIMSCNSNLMSELEGAKVHLEQFYPSDDEVPSIDSNENEAVSDLLEQKSAADLNPDFSLQPLPNDLPSMPLTQVDEYYEYNAADVSNDPGSLMHAATFERNLTVEQFIRQWCLRSRLPHDRLGMKESFIPISSEAARVLNWSRPEKISRPENHRHRSFDIQNIPWSHKLNVKREDARMLRDRMYTSYHNLRYDAHGFAAKLPQKENYFKAKSMYTTFKASMAHFQLRNLMSVTASNTVQYVSRSKVYSVTPFYNHTACLMDLCDVSSSDILFDSVKISTMKSKHGVAIIGGFGGEYAYRSDMSHQSRVEGHITRNQNSITNHIDVVQHRTSRNPQAIISSNDQCIRILDCETNKFVRVQEFARAINCTDTSPDGRLRVIVGDSPDAWVVDSDSGKPLQALAGHQDYGFACAWSPDMLHIATSNQDKTVNIWDARMWRILQTIDSDVAGYRSLRFSPVGGGPRTLLMCEPADRIAIVNAQTYQTRQVHDFFGEIGGADYSPDGGRIWVANMDAKFGGLMEFDRCEWGQEFGIGHTKRRHIESRGDLYHPDLPNEWLPEADLDGDPRCVLGPGEREMRFERLSLLNDTADLDELLG